MKGNIEQVIKLLKGEGVLILPTDTIPGICCNALHTQSIARINFIKNRDSNKGHVNLVSSVDMLKKYVSVSHTEILKLQDYTEALTVVYPKFSLLSPLAGAENGSIAVRIVKDAILAKIIHEVGSPIIASSANFADEKPPISLSKGIDKKFISLVDLCIDIPEIQGTGKASTILQWSEPEQKFISLRP